MLIPTSDIHDHTVSCVNVPSTGSCLLKVSIMSPLSRVSVLTKDTFEASRFSRLLPRIPSWSGQYIHQHFVNEKCLFLIPIFVYQIPSGTLLLIRSTKGTLNWLPVQMQLVIHAQGVFTIPHPPRPLPALAAPSKNQSIYHCCFHTTAMLQTAIDFNTGSYWRLWASFIQYPGPGVCQHGILRTWLLHLTIEVPTFFSGEWEMAHDSQPCVATEKLNALMILFRFVCWCYSIGS